MKKATPFTEEIGRYRGAISADFDCPELRTQLEGLAGLLSRVGAGRPTLGRNRTVRLSLAAAGRTVQAAVKIYRREHALKNLLDRRRGSKASRSWVIAAALRERGVGTPAPIAFLDRWDGSRLKESYFLSEYQDGISSFRAELNYLYAERPEARCLMDLLQCVADGVRAMHDAGIVHRDLGNQNILLRRTATAAWAEVQFIDLNRARLRTAVSLAECAFDVSRIALPSELLRVFKEMYFAPMRPPAAFQRLECRYRRRFAWHTRTRRLRHPLRTAARRRQGLSGPAYPDPRDIWIWDDRSGQPISAMRAAERKRYYPFANVCRMACATLAGAGPVWREFRALRRVCYRMPVLMQDRIGIAVHPTPQTAERELEALAGLGRTPVLLRLAHHRSAAELDFSVRCARALYGRGHPVSVALVQDRLAVRDPERWASFVERMLEQVADVAEWVELGHAVNRVKWGVWTFDEYRRLMNACCDIRARYPDVRLMGPAVIDFEYPFAMAALRACPEPLSFDALSLHLYVDRRGAPENRQGPFDALAKFALARAVARSTPQCADRIVVSEVNWPIKGAGVYSPVGSPYESPGPRFNDPSVTEEDYANYMIRYLLHALCSGMVERVYWWRLAARGYGLVDDTDPLNWRQRRAYTMLARFLAVLGGATFTDKPPTADGTHLFLFQRPDGERVALAYSTAGEITCALPFSYADACDGIGRPIREKGAEVRLSGSPKYFLDVRV